MPRAASSLSGHHENEHLYSLGTFVECDPSNDPYQKILGNVGGGGGGWGGGGGGSPQLAQRGGAGGGYLSSQDSNALDSPDLNSASPATPPSSSAVSAGRGGSPSFERGERWSLRLKRSNRNSSLRGTKKAAVR